jgi:hypothetical protein
MEKLKKATNTYNFISNTILIIGITGFLAMFIYYISSYDVDLSYGFIILGISCTISFVCKIVYAILYRLDILIENTKKDTK